MYDHKTVSGLDLWLPCICFDILGEIRWDKSWEMYCCLCHDPNGTCWGFDIVQPLATAVTVHTLECKPL